MAVLWLLCGISLLLFDYNAFGKERRCPMPDYYNACAEGSRYPESGEKPCQLPRFQTARKGQNVNFICIKNDYDSRNANVTWFIGHPNGSVINYLVESDPGFHGTFNNSRRCSRLIISKIQEHNSGIYFCKYNNSKGELKSGCGSELKVVDCTNTETVNSRNAMKDAIIMIQTLLILLFTTVPIFLLNEMNKRRSVTLEDHTYEGLEIDHTATYEDILTVRLASTKLMVGEHPCQE
ncbi:B-cell antigen receptor complex-associated protein beta chain [Bombina bombina]|uniref:B-cell antigen receptor complex-associated protein beta chain n=1 Tax=Bombina bombina TaxID=8345 RepID=UPI00235B15A4|nr:B-cell antigen receptor complex-associated protein beta chain [Bombina bombina]